MDLLASQLMDPFRIGLVFFLLVTAIRTRAATGMIMPLAFGVIFFAILLPLTTGRAQLEGSALWQVIATGIAANAIILSVFLTAWSAWSALRKTR